MRRVLIVGHPEPWELPTSYVHAFEALGAEVELFDYRGRLRRVSQATPTRGGRFLAVAAGRRVVAAQFVLAARRFQPELIFITKTDDLPTVTYALLRRAVSGVKIAAFHPDDPFNVTFFRGPSHRRARDQMRAVDAYFVWSQGLVERAKAVGAKHAHYLGFGVDESFVHPMTLTEDERARFASDVCFVGNWDKKREAWLEPLCESDLDVAIYGSPDWTRKTTSRAVQRRYRGTFANGPDFARAVTASKASINILRVQNEGAENMRTYETPACGVVALCEHSDVGAALFRPGIEAIYARTPIELRDEAIAITRMSPEARATIGRAALERSRAHSYTERARRILELVAGR